MERSYLTSKQMAEVLKISEHELLELVKNKQIPFEVTDEGTVYEAYRFIEKDVLKAFKPREIEEEETVKEPEPEQPVEEEAEAENPEEEAEVEAEEPTEDQAEPEEAAEEEATSEPEQPSEKAEDEGKDPFEKEKEEESKK